MGQGDVRLIALLAIAMVTSSVAVMAFSRIAPLLGIIDLPGGRKTHGEPVPLVGGLAVFMSLLTVAAFEGIAEGASYFLLALSIVIAIGFWDDVREIRPRLKFTIQVVASVIMIWGAGVQLHEVGDLLGWRSIGLWTFSIPLTIFAIVGVVNALNMMDGLDGLGGSIALVAFAWFALVASNSGLDVPAKMAVIFCGATAGFLLFNLRFPWQRSARAFLGDAGSLMIGFALGWYAIDLTQGKGRTFPPIAALWVLLLPLADCVSLMTRRIMAGRSPFVADSHHIHHLLLAKGFTHGQTLGILVACSTLFGAVGYLGWQLNAREHYLFWPFFVGFFAYHIWITRAWRKVDETRGFVETATFTPPVTKTTEKKGVSTA